MFRTWGAGLALLLCAAAYGYAQSPVDPCQSGPKIATPLNLTANGTLINRASARKNYLCAIVVVASGAETISVVEGSGTTCATSPLALMGGALAASGLALPANGILTAGDGNGTIAAGTNANFDVCILKSGSNRVSGSVTYVQQ